LSWLVALVCSPIWLTAALARLRAARAADRELAWAQVLETRHSLPATMALGQALPGFVLDIDATITKKRLRSLAWSCRADEFGDHDGQAGGQAQGQPQRGQPVVQRGIARDRLLHREPRRTTHEGECRHYQKDHDRTCAWMKG
jgi:hypothetical protein